MGRNPYFRFVNFYINRIAVKNVTEHQLCFAGLNMDTWKSIYSHRTQLHNKYERVFLSCYSREITI